ncbi:MAG TPA: hypothetical protein PK385_00755 [Spirochaetota bacterium]|nr:hypothetical protein [Spirochaetota bacterium]HOS31727.1 hypothetical protein [Spirochaetota bacterium]HOS54567.1 hypothetical protein [Spirochaetota bacterium]HPK61283.1 hypothetical protein [Spirochaetota bacterium]HQF77209.1 hypothetical protein [Spirochaetota bacterium]
MKRVMLSIICAIIPIALFAQISLEKRYSKNIFNGGKEYIKFADEDDKESILISYQLVKVDLYENFSKINISYIIINKSSSKIEFDFCYPKLDTAISKNVVKFSALDGTIVDKSVVEYTINGNYTDYKITVNGLKKDFLVISGIYQEKNVPFFSGDTKDYIDGDKNVSENIDSFLYNYGWYKTPISIEAKKKILINISYSTSHYFNEIIQDKGSKILSEDPALNYNYVDIEDKRIYNSDKIFSFYFFTDYVDQILPANKRVVKIVNHLIDDDYINISPKKFKKKSGSTYIYKTRNKRTTSLDNIFIKISDTYNPKTISSLYFKSTPQRITRDHSSFYTIDKFNKEITLEYLPNNKSADSSLYPDNDDITVSEIRILPKIYTRKEAIKESNNPLKFEILFSDNAEFSNAVSAIKTIKLREYFTLIKKKNYISIYKGDRATCKFIKIKFLETSLSPEDSIHINDIEILR